MTQKSERNSGCRLSFSSKQGKVRIYKGVLSALGEPRFIQFLINPEKKMLILCGSNTRLSECIEVPSKEYQARNGFVLNGHGFIRRIFSIMRWAPLGTYLVDGIYDKDLSCVVFALEQNTLIERDDDDDDDDN